MTRVLWRIVALGSWLKNLKPMIKNKTLAGHRGTVDDGDSTAQSKSLYARIVRLIMLLCLGLAVDLVDDSLLLEAREAVTKLASVRRLTKALGS